MLGQAVILVNVVVESILVLEVCFIPFVWWVWEVAIKVACISALTMQMFERLEHGQGM